MTRHLSSPILLAMALGVLATGSCRDGSTQDPQPDTQGLEGFFSPQPGEVWTYAVTRDFAPGTKLRPGEEAKATTLPNGAKRVSFERRRICAGPERPEGAEKDLIAFELHEDGFLMEREFYDITSAGFIGRGWTPAPEVTPAIKPPPKGILLTPGVTIAQPRMVGGQSWTAPGVKSDSLFELHVIERTTVTVPAGEFETARIRLTTSGSTRNTKRTVWFAENVGIVKEEVIHYGPERILVKEDLLLKKWSLPSDNREEPGASVINDPVPPEEAALLLETETDLPIPDGYGPPYSPADGADDAGEMEASNEPGGAAGAAADEQEATTGEGDSPPPVDDSPEDPPSDDDPAPPRAEIVEE